MLFNNGLCTVITFINDPLHFTVDRCGNLFTITSGGMTKISSDKYFIIIISIAYKTKCFRHTELRYHGFGVCCCLLDILGCPGCNIIKDQLFCYTST